MPARHVGFAAGKKIIDLFFPKRLRSLNNPGKGPPERRLLAPGRLREGARVAAGGIPDGVAAREAVPVAEPRLERPPGTPFNALQYQILP